MPKVGGKHYPYTPGGLKKAEEEDRKTEKPVVKEKPMKKGK